MAVDGIASHVADVATNSGAGLTTTKPLLFRGYVPGLDVLRGIAILEVILYHGIDGRSNFGNYSGLARWFVFSMEWGATGVELFFILSGFLISGILIDSVKRPDYYRRFYFNRVCRILPAYILMIAVLKGLHVVSWRFVLACMLYIANMAKIVGARSEEYGVFWTLAVEEQFYLLWPIAIRRFGLAALTRFIWFYFAFAIAARGVMAWKVPQFDMYSKLWGSADWLLVGALVAITLRTGQLHAGNIGRWLRATAVTGVVFCVLTVWLDVHGDVPGIQQLWMAPTHRFGTFCLYTSMLLYVVANNTGEASKGLVPRVFRFLGYISYGLYLVHPLIYNETNVWVQGTWLATYPHHLGPLLVLWVLGTALAVGIATLSRVYFEGYFLRLKERRARMRAVTA